MICTQLDSVESNQKLDEMARALNEADSSRKKLQVENQDLTRQIEETENAIALLGKSKISLTTQVEDNKHLGDSESRERATLLSRFKILNTEVRNIFIRYFTKDECSYHIPYFLLWFPPLNTFLP